MPGTEKVYGGMAAMYVRTWALLRLRLRCYGELRYLLHGGIICPAGHYCAGGTEPLRLCTALPGESTSSLRVAPYPRQY
eukprot:2597222-Rhodomonas_salina.1